MWLNMLMHHVINKSQKIFYVIPFSITPFSFVLQSFDLEKIPDREFR